jgi:hypothetical protein
MALFWLNYRQGAVFEGVAIIESDTLIAARMKALIKNIDHGMTFAEGYELDAESAAMVPSGVIDSMLTLAQAEGLLALFKARKTLTKPRSR